MTRPGRLFDHEAELPDNANEAVTLGRTMRIQGKPSAPAWGRRDLPKVIQSVWTEHRKRYPGLQLPVELPASSIECLVGGFSSIRGLQRSFEDAVARAARRPGRLRLIATDLAGGNPLKLVGG